MVETEKRRSVVRLFNLPSILAETVRLLFCVFRNLEMFLSQAEGIAFIHAKSNTTQLESGSPSSISTSNLNLHT